MEEYITTILTQFLLQETTVPAWFLILLGMLVFSSGVCHGFHRSTKNLGKFLAKKDKKENK